MEIHWPHFEMVRCATPKVRCIFRLCHWSCPCTPGVCYVDTLNTVFMLCLSYRRFAMSLCYVCCIHSYFSWEVASVMHPLFLIRPVSWSTHKHPYHHLYIYIYIGSLHFGCSWKINGLIFNHINILCRSSLDAFSIPSSIEKLIPWSHVVKYWKIDPA